MVQRCKAVFLEYGRRALVRHVELVLMPSICYVRVVGLLRREQLGNFQYGRASASIGRLLSLSALFALSLVERGLL